MTAEELFAYLTKIVKPNVEDFSSEMVEENGFVGTYVSVNGEDFYIQIQPV